jgi:hypothetical protein
VPCVGKVCVGGIRVWGLIIIEDGYATGDPKSQRGGVSIFQKRRNDVILYGYTVNRTINLCIYGSFCAVYVNINYVTLCTVQLSAYIWGV